MARSCVELTRQGEIPFLGANAAHVGALFSTSDAGWPGTGYAAPITWRLHLAFRERIAGCGQFSFTPLELQFAMSRITAREEAVTDAHAQPEARSIACHNHRPLTCGVDFEEPLRRSTRYSHTKSF